MHKPSHPHHYRHIDILFSPFIFTHMTLYFSSLLTSLSPCLPNHLYARSNPCRIFSLVLLFLFNYIFLLHTSTPALFSSTSLFSILLFTISSLVLYILYFLIFLFNPILPLVLFVRFPFSSFLELNPFSRLKGHLSCNVFLRLPTNFSSRREGWFSYR